MHDKLVLSLPGGQQQEFALANEQVKLGRATTNDIVLKDPHASRFHACLEVVAAGGYAIVDLGSANGTMVNGVRSERTILKPGDLVQVGDSVLRYERSAARDEPELERVESEADLQATLARGSIPMALENHRVPRVAIHTQTRTWEVPLEDQAVVIGRDPKSDIPLDDAKASRSHARIERRGDDFYLCDLGSTNGTFVGANRINEHRLENGDSLRIGNATLVFKRSFESQDLTIESAATMVDAGPLRERRPPVVFVPGLLGSELYLGSEKIWPNPRVLLAAVEMLRLPGPGQVEPRGILNEVAIVPNLVKLQQYSQLGDYLEDSLGYERGKDLLEFAYDFRQDVRQSAQKLSETIERWAPTRPVTLIAHSLGCLVSRYYIKRLGGHRKVGRLILVGGPQSGTPLAISLLLKGPDLLPFGLMGERFREVLATWPSIFQILPTYSSAFDQLVKPIDVLADEMWVPDGYRPYLRLASEFRRELGATTGIPTVCIFGYGMKTISRVNVERDTVGRPPKSRVRLGKPGRQQYPRVERRNGRCRDSSRKAISRVLVRRQ